MKILFIHPNDHLIIGIPAGITFLSSILKNKGHIVDLFDFTFIKTKNEKTNKEYGNKGLYKPTKYTLEDLVKDDPVQTIEEAFLEKLNTFKPDLIAVSVMTGYFDYIVNLLEKVKPNCPVIVGGVHPTIYPEDALLRSNSIDYICIGEGEKLIVEFCKLMEQNKDFHHIDNLGYKKNGRVILNKLSPFNNLDELPMPDWSIFDERHLFRPFMGNIYKGSFYIMSRGCPYNCTYCVNWGLKDTQKDCGKYYRYQSPETTGKQLKYLKENFGATWFKFADDTITAMSKEYLEELSEKIKPLDIMFGCSIRPETVSERKVKLLKSMGCVAASVGIESGNQQIRKNILNRNMSNEQIEIAIKILQKYDIRVSTFNMIGLPEENRENVFETIRLNKKLNIEAVNVYIVYPYPGTALYTKYNINFRDNNRKIIPVSQASSFKLSKMSPMEVEGLLRTFELYVNLPEEMWPKIKEAEGISEKAVKIRKELEEYRINLFNK